MPYFLKNDNGEAVDLPQGAASLFGLRRERGQTKFSPSKIFRAFKDGKIKGAVVIGFEDTRKKIRRPGTCVIRIGGIGDLIMLSSSLIKMKYKQPDTPLVLATVPQHREIFKHLSCLDDCITVKQANRFIFDRVIDLRYAVEPKRLAPELGRLPWRDYTDRDRSDNFDKLCGVRGKSKTFEIPVSKNSVERMKEKIGKGGPVVAFTPTCYAIHRAMPADYVRPIINGLIKKLSARVVLFGKTEKWNRNISRIKTPGLVNLINKTDLKEAIAICAVSDMVITPDTGFVHVAGALKKKCLAVFGNIHPKTRIKYYPTVKPIFAKSADVLACVPCWDLHEGCRLHKSSPPCMRLLGVDKIVGETRRMLSA